MWHDIMVDYPIEITDVQVRKRNTVFPCASAAILPKTDAFACGAAVLVQEAPRKRGGQGRVRSNAHTHSRQHTDILADMMRASSADVPGLVFDLWAAENRALNLHGKKGTDSKNPAAFAQVGPLCRRDQRRGCRGHPHRLRAD